MKLVYLTMGISLLTWLTARVVAFGARQPPSDVERKRQAWRRSTPSDELERRRQAFERVR